MSQVFRSYKLENYPRISSLIVNQDSELEKAKRRGEADAGYTRRDEFMDQYIGYYTKFSKW